MSHLKRNLVANFAGRGWSALMGLAFIPLYIRFMGIEAYGLVGFFTTLQAVFTLFDLGLTTTLNRELARCSALPDKTYEMRDLVRTLETLYWGLAVCIGTAVIALSPFIAHGWVKAETLPVSVVQQAVMLMGLVIAFQWPLGFYSGGLLGLQRQVLYNILNAGWFTLRFAGAVIVLRFVSPTVFAFFTWQVFASAISTFLTASTLWHNLPTSRQLPRFRIDVLRLVWRFAAGMGAISVTVLLLTQLDKIILSKLLSLEKFGYYSLASTVANGLTYLVGPVFMALFPNFSQRVALGDQTGLKDMYHRACQLMSVIILPAAVVVTLFAPEILLIWTRNLTTVENTHTLVSLLVIGTALNGLMNLPYALQLAHGWTKLTFYTNVVSVIALIPLLIATTLRYGAIGAAVVWVVLNGGYVLIELQLMHRRLLPGEQWRWYLEDVGLPLAATSLIAGLARWTIVEPSPVVMMLVSLVLVSLSALVASAWVTPVTRQWIKRAVAGKRLLGVQI